MRFTYTISRNVLNGSKRGSAIRCPVARCLSKATDRQWYVYFTAIRDSLDNTWYETTAALQDWIKDYDYGLSVEPIDIWIDEEKHLIGRMSLRAPVTV